MSLRLLLTLAAVLCSSGCQKYVILLEPRQGDRLDNIGSAPSPIFTWKTDVLTQHRVEYTLTVRGGSDTMFTKSRLTEREYQIQASEGWLPGGGQYDWTVEGQVVNDEGKVLEKLLCKEPRRFELGKRDTVKIQFSSPTVGAGDERQKVKATIQIADDAKTGDFEVEMENGEQRQVSITAENASKRISITGTITVLKANENTKLGKVLVSDLDWDEFLRIAEKGDVGEHRYMLGGEEIVRLKLGSRS